MSRPTASELLFEEFCKASGVVCSRVATAAVRTPDFVVDFGGIQVTCRRDRAIADLTDPHFSIAHIAVEVERVVALGEVGVVTGRSDVEGRIGEHTLSGVFRFTHVWRRCEGAWQMVAGHTSPAGVRVDRESPFGGAAQQAAAPDGRRGF